MWEIANHFRAWVCRELRNLDEKERISLRGDYLFVVDQKPRFIVMVDRKGAWSLFLSEENPCLSYEVDEGCLFEVESTQIQNALDGSCRAQISTDSKTLEKILLGTLKGYVAFVTGKVTIERDLMSFLKMVSLLKKRKSELSISKTV